MENRATVVENWHWARQWLYSRSSHTSTSSIASSQLIIRRESGSSLTIHPVSTRRRIRRGRGFWWRIPLGSISKRHRDDEQSRWSISRVRDSLWRSPQISTIRRYRDPRHLFKQYDWQQLWLGIREAIDWCDNRGRFVPTDCARLYARIDLENIATSSGSLRQPSTPNLSELGFAGEHWCRVTNSNDTEVYTFGRTSLFS